MRITRFPADLTQVDNTLTVTLIISLVTVALEADMRVSKIPLSFRDLDSVTWRKGLLNLYRSIEWSPEGLVDGLNRRRSEQAASMASQARERERRGKHHREEPLLG
jgi:hypothetical protein